MVSMLNETAEGRAQQLLIKKRENKKKGKALGQMKLTCSRRTSVSRSISRSYPFGFVMLAVFLFIRREAREKDRHRRDHHASSEHLRLLVQ